MARKHAALFQNWVYVVLRKGHLNCDISRTLCASVFMIRDVSEIYTLSGEYVGRKEKSSASRRGYFNDILRLVKTII